MAIFNDYEKQLKDLKAAYPKFGAGNDQAAAAMARQLEGILDMAISDLQAQLRLLDGDVTTKLESIESEIRGDGIKDSSIREDFVKKVASLQEIVGTIALKMKHLSYQEHMVAATRDGNTHLKKSGEGTSAI